MAHAIRTPQRWQIRLVGVVLLVFALVIGLLGHTPAYADDRDDRDDDYEMVATGPNVCTTNANLPIYSNATCVKHSTERDDGGTETENHYVTQDAVETVRLAFEAAFRPNGWTLVRGGYDPQDQEWEYTVTQGMQRVEVTIDAGRMAAGAGTNIEIEEE